MEERASFIYICLLSSSHDNRQGRHGMTCKFILLWQGGAPFSGIQLHELLPEGGTGPELRDCKGTNLILIHSSFSPSRTLPALCGWTLRTRTSAVTAKAMLRNLMIFDGLSKEEMIKAIFLDGQINMHIWKRTTISVIYMHICS